MKRPVKAKSKRGAKRGLFAELSEGMEALAEAPQVQANASNPRSGA